MVLPDAYVISPCLTPWRSTDSAHVPVACGAERIKQKGHPRVPAM